MRKTDAQARAGRDRRTVLGMPSPARTGAATGGSRLAQE